MGRAPSGVPAAPRPVLRQTHGAGGFQPWPERGPARAWGQDPVFLRKDNWGPYLRHQTESPFNQGWGFGGMEAGT